MQGTQLKLYQSVHFISISIFWIKLKISHYLLALKEIANQTKPRRTKLNILIHLIHLNPPSNEFSSFIHIVYLFIVNLIVMDQV